MALITEKKNNFWLLSNFGSSVNLLRLEERSDQSEINNKMEPKESESKRNPRKSANLISRIFFGWTISIFKRTHDKVLYSSDVFEPLSEDLSNVLGDRLER